MIIVTQFGNAGYIALNSNTFIIVHQFDDTRLNYSNIDTNTTENLITAIHKVNGLRSIRIYFMHVSLQETSLASNAKSRQICPDIHILSLSGNIIDIHIIHTLTLSGVAAPD